MDKHGNVLDMGNSVPVSSTSDSVLKLQRSISSKLDIVLIESPIKKNKVKGQNSIAGLGLKPQPSPISHVASFRELSMILYLDTFLAFPLRMLDNGSELNAIVTYVCFLYLLWVYFIWVLLFFYKFRLSEILFSVSCRLLPNHILHNYQLLFSDVINSRFRNTDVLVLFEIIYDLLLEVCGFLLLFNFCYWKRLWFDLLCLGWIFAINDLTSLIIMVFDYVNPLIIIQIRFIVINWLSYIPSLIELCPLFYAGAKEEIYFDPRSCLESDCEDFFSISSGEICFQFVP